MNIFLYLYVLKQKNDVKTPKSSSNFKRCLLKKACSHLSSRSSIKIMHIDIIFNVSISMTMINSVKCEMKILSKYWWFISYNLILETWMSFVFFLLNLLLLNITLRREYLRNFNLLETKVNPARNSYCVYNHVVHK